MTDGVAEARGRRGGGEGERSVVAAHPYRSSPHSQVATYFSNVSNGGDDARKRTRGENNGCCECNKQI